MAAELTLKAKARATVETARNDTEPTPAARAKPAPEPTRLTGAATGSASDDHQRSPALAAARSTNEPKPRAEPTAAGGAAPRKPLSAQRTNSPNARATDPRAVPPEVTELERSNVCMTRRKTALTCCRRQACPVGHSKIWPLKVDNDRPKLPPNLISSCHRCGSYWTGTGHCGRCNRTGAQGPGPCNRHLTTRGRP